ncbi:hypothetical protein B9Z55_017570 [Caenorhabditis nigoni]|nr:hypothetical protein B9Z55_017570 [Caenorhabditis nigoni]
MDRFFAKLVALLLVLLQIGAIMTTPIPEAAPEDVETRRELEKRGGARAFYGFYNAGNSKRDQVALPYYLYEKRGGGRAFNHNANLFRYEKRGGGRAFAGSWSPYLERFYDYKRSGYPIYFSDNSYY